MKQPEIRQRSDGKRVIELDLDPGSCIFVQGDQVVDDSGDGGTVELRIIKSGGHKDTHYMVVAYTDKELGEVVISNDSYEAWGWSVIKRIELQEKPKRSKAIKKKDILKMIEMGFNMGVSVVSDTFMVEEDMKRTYVSQIFNSYFDVLSEQEDE